MISDIYQGLIPVSLVMEFVQLPGNHTQFSWLLLSPSHGFATGSTSVAQVASSPGSSTCRHQGSWKGIAETPQISYTLPALSVKGPCAWDEEGSEVPADPCAQGKAIVFIKKNGTREPFPGKWPSAPLLFFLLQHWGNSQAIGPKCQHCLVFVSMQHC